jgi:hypothetical protein
LQAKAKGNYCPKRLEQKRGNGYCLKVQLREKIKGKNTRIRLLKETSSDDPSEKSAKPVVQT